MLEEEARQARLAAGSMSSEERDKINKIVEDVSTHTRDPLDISNILLCSREQKLRMST